MAHVSRAHTPLSDVPTLLPGFSFFRWRPGVVVLPRETQPLLLFVSNCGGRSAQRRPRWGLGVYLHVYTFYIVMLDDGGGKTWRQNGE